MKEEQQTNSNSLTAVLKLIDKYDNLIKAEETAINTLKALEDLLGKIEVNQCITCEIPVQNRKCERCFYRCRSFEDACDRCGVSEWIYLDGEKTTYGKNHQLSFSDRVPKELQSLKTWRINHH